jgi:hypothetical protein
MYICEEGTEGARLIDGLCVSSNEENEVEVFLSANKLARHGSLLFLFSSLAEKGYRREDIIKMVNSSFDQVEDES